jgi:hypothetical protein
MPPVSEDLAFAISRVVAQLHHRQHGVNGQPIAAAAQRLRNIAAQTEAELLGARRAQIVLCPLRHLTR